MIDSSCNDEKTVKYNIVLLCHYSFDYDELDSASPVQPGQWDCYQPPHEGR